MILAFELYSMNNSVFTMFTKESILKIMRFYLLERRIELKRSKNNLSIKERMLSESLRPQRLKINASTSMRREEKVNQTPRWQLSCQYASGQLTLLAGHEI